MRRAFLSLLAAALLLLPLSACAAGSQDDARLQLYFASASSSGPAIVGEAYTSSAAPTAERLIRALLSGPNSEQLYSPFPTGLALRSCTLEDGLLTVDFSEPYGGLTDVSLTLADYCVVLTVCQLEGVEQVEITVSGRTMPYRSHQILTADEVMLDVQSSG